MIKNKNEVKKMKEYYLHLNEEPFNLIKNHEKTIEMRLYDEKRKKLSVGDVLIFVNRNDEREIIKTQIVDLHKYESFAELYKNFDKTQLGYRKDEQADPSDMNKYYSKEDEQKFGVVGIEIKII